MVQVPAGTYTVGVPQPDEFHVAPRTISLESFWIDQYEVTNEEYQRFMSETGSPAPIVPLGAANFPVIGVDFERAKAYCQWLNKRLPKEAEWEASGRGAGENPGLYPTEDPTFTLNFPNVLYGVGTLANNVSPFEVYDLVGNVWEWVDEPYEPIPPDKNVLRGGRYSLPQDLAYRYLLSSDNANVKYAGFRCAATEASP
jgi:formylglycine-generating enzyme required for sulfatase activity